MEQKTVSFKELSAELTTLLKSGTSEVVVRMNPYYSTAIVETNPEGTSVRNWNSAKWCKKEEIPQIIGDLIALAIPVFRIKTEKIPYLSEFFTLYY